MDKISKFEQVMDHVYGKYSTDWRPKPFKKGQPRYLWTDAYGVCNYLTLFHETKNENYLNQAKHLIEEVHNILGKSRDGTKRLNNSSEEHPLNGGLRIGKTDGEGAGISADGQYFHYLTKWMFALNRMSLISKDVKYNKWGIEMAQAIHWKFCSTNRQRMFWKMSIDLSKPLVNSEGGLDTYDGLTMYMILQNTQKVFDGYDKIGDEEKKQWEEKNLKPEIDHMKSLVAARYKNYSTNDSLDAGEALWLAHFFPELDYAKHLKAQAEAAVESLHKFGEFSGPAHHRLAFREFGTTIGVQMHDELWQQKGWNKRVEDLYQFWESSLYARDNDITPIMFCTSLIPGVFNNSYLSME